LSCPRGRLMRCAHSQKDGQECGWAPNGAISTRKANGYGNPPNDANYPSSGVGAVLSRLDNIAPVSGDHYAAYTYLGASTVIKVEYPAVANTLALTYGGSGDGYAGLDRFGRVVDQKWQTQGGTPAVKDRFKYGYDYAGNRLYRTNELDPNFGELYHANGGAYDGLDRLREWRRGKLSAGQDELTDANTTRRGKYTLDPVGNWSEYQAGSTGATFDLTQFRTHDKANEIWAADGNSISGAWVDPNYDPAGNMITGPQPRYETADANSQWYKYDAWNRLTRLGQGASSPGTTVVTYSYDGQNRRIRKAVAGDDTYDYYYNESWQVLEVRKDSRTNKTYQQYVWGVQYIDAPVVQFRDTADDGVLEQALYYMYDGNFNVTAVIGTNGTVAERYTYDPYGKVTFKAADWSDAASQARSAYDNEILYCGYRFDPESGLYHVRNRYLTPPLGRWLTTDLIGYGDGMNLYQYLRSNSTNSADPQGLKNVRWYPEGTIKDENVKWSYSYDATFHVFDCRLGFRVKVQLYADGSQEQKVRSQIKQLMPKWDQAVEAQFNKWKLMPKDISRCWVCCKGIALTFRATFVDSWTWTDDQEVAVRPEAGRSNMRKWYLGSPGVSSAPYKTVVHEVAHMFGLKDEYRDPVYYPTRVEPVDRHSSIMWDSSRGDILQRHIEDIVYNAAKIQHNLPCQYEVKPR